MIQISINYFAKTIAFKIVHTRDNDDFQGNLQWIKSNIDPADRTYNERTRAFIVKDLAKYARKFALIRKAVKNKRRTITIF